MSNTWQATCLSWTPLLQIMFNFKRTCLWNTMCPWAIIALTALILMSWTLSLLVWFFSRKFVQPAHYTASAIVLCTLPIHNIFISCLAHIFATRLYGIRCNRAFSLSMMFLQQVRVKNLDSRFAA